MSISPKAIKDQIKKAIKFINEKKPLLASLSKELKPQSRLSYDEDFKASRIEAKCLEIYNQYFKTITGEDPEKASKVKHFFATMLLSIVSFTIVSTYNRTIITKIITVAQGLDKDASSKDVENAFKKLIQGVQQPSIIHVVIKSIYKVIGYIIFVAVMYYKIYETPINAIRKILKTLIIGAALTFSVIVASERETMGVSLARGLAEIAAGAGIALVVEELLTRLILKLFNSLRSGELQILRQFIIVLYIVPVIANTAGYIISKTSG